MNLWKDAMGFLSALLNETQVSALGEVLHSLRRQVLPEEEKG